VVAPRAMHLVKRCHTVLGMSGSIGAAERPWPSWLQRRPDWRVDVAVAVLVGVLQTALSALAARGQEERESLDALAYFLLAAGPAALVFRRRYPISVLLVVFGASVAYWTLDYPRGPVFLALIVAFITVLLAGQRTAAIAVAVAGWLAFPWLPYLVGDETSRPNWLHLLGLGAWLFVLLAVGEIARNRRERLEEALRIRDEEQRRRASEERLRIARDLHDVVAHHISLINIQSGVALHLMDEQPEQTRTALTAIKQASAEALQELRSVLDILRQRDEDAPRAPTPGLDEMDTLVSRANAAGLDVQADVEGTRHPLPVSVDTTAYRIVQEALTNVARHAGAATATIRLDYGDHDLVVEVEDDGQGPAVNGGASRGNGIPNMRERAEALGGHLDAGPRPGGGFRVRAWLPLEPDGEAVE
jgi:signal transduction histidine kinase